MITMSCLNEKHHCTGTECACWCHKAPAKTWPNKIIEKPERKYVCMACSSWFDDLRNIPNGWTVTTKMVEHLVTHNYYLLYFCRCPVHPAPRVDNIFSGESIAWDEGKQAFVGYTAPKPTVHCMHVHDNCLNPDAVAVKWFECALCGRTRSEVVRKGVW